MKLHLIGSVLAALLAVVLLHVWRNFPWILAFFGGASIGALVFFTVATVRRLAEELRRP